MRLAMIGVIIFTILPSILFCQERPLGADQISVLGSIELREIADQASLTFSIKGVGSSLRRAVEDASQKVQTLTQKLIGVGLSMKNISTSKFFSSENYGDKAFLSHSRDFRAVLVTKIIVDSLSLLEPILFAIGDDENVENLSDISFSFKDELGLRKKARSEAALKAKEKAGDIATALGVMVGAVINIEELEPAKVTRQVDNYSPYGFYNLQKASPFNPITLPDLSQKPQVDESRGSGFFAQTISITSQVKVIFAIK